MLFRRKLLYLLLQQVAARLHVLQLLSESALNWRLLNARFESISQHPDLYDLMIAVMLLRHRGSVSLQIEHQVTELDRLDEKISQKLSESTNAEKILQFHTPRGRIYIYQIKTT